MTVKFDLNKFLEAFEKAFGEQNESQTEGLRFLLGKLESEASNFNNDLRQIGYLLATVKWETANSFQPRKEKRARPGTKLRAIQDRYWGSGYYGRGYVQITWAKNYETFLIAQDPDAALEPDTAYLIASSGMRRGLFTGRKLSDYFNTDKEDFFNARRIINGLDRADEIAAIARKIQACLSLALIREPVVQPEPAQLPSKPEGDTPAVNPVESSPSAFQSAKSAFMGMEPESRKSLLSVLGSKAWGLLCALGLYAANNPWKIVAISVIAVGGFCLIFYYMKRQKDKTIAKIRAAADVEVATINARSV